MDERVIVLYHAALELIAKIDMAQDTQIKQLRNRLQEELKLPLTEYDQTALRLIADICSAALNQSTN